MTASLRIAILGPLLGATLGAAAEAQDTARVYPPSIHVTASAEVQMSPDRATVNIGVQTRAPSAADAVAQNSRKQRAVIDAIRARGIAPELIGTQGFNVIPETRYDREGQQAPRVLSYLVSNVVSVDVRKIDLVGPVIDAALGAGANQVNSLSFGLINADSARRVALSRAVTRARADAEAMARAAGGSLGQLLEIRSVDFMGPPRPMMMDARAVGEAMVPIEPGQETVRASVSARWRFSGG